MYNCSVDNHIVENYEANIINWYPMEMTVSSFTVYVNGSWYTQGECGGLIGYIQSTSALINKCSVTNTDMRCYGQPDKDVKAGVFTSWTDIKTAGPDPGKNAFATGKTLIAGRHVNQFIGDIVSARTESDVNNNKDTYTVEIRDYYVNGNMYHSSPVTNPTSISLKEQKSMPYPRTTFYNDTPTSHAYGCKTQVRESGFIIKTKYYTHTVNAFCNCVGSAYYVGVDVDLFGQKKHVKACAGTLIFNEIDKSSDKVTVTESVGDGNNIAWTGGDFWM